MARTIRLNGQARTRAPPMRGDETACCVVLMTPHSNRESDCQTWRARTVRSDDEVGLASLSRAIDTHLAVSRRAGARTCSCDLLRRLYPEEASLEDEVDLGLGHLVDVVGQRFPEVGVRGEAAVAPVDFGDGERDALTSGSVDQTMGERR
jgi:hypothetical protein